MVPNLDAKEIFISYSGEVALTYNKWVLCMSKIEPKDLENSLSPDSEFFEMLDENWLPLRDLDCINKKSLRAAEEYINRFVWWYSNWDCSVYLKDRSPKVSAKAIRRAFVGCKSSHPEWGRFVAKIKSESWMTETMYAAIKSTRKAYWEKRHPSLMQLVKKLMSDMKAKLIKMKQENILSKIEKKRKTFTPSITK
jgi:hypothetical protein